MSRYRRRQSSHKDSNHDAMVRELRQCGASVIETHVIETHALGSGAPDLIVGYQGVTALIEIKNGEGYHQTQRDKRLGSSHRGQAQEARAHSRSALTDATAHPACGARE